MKKIYFTLLLLVICLTGCATSYFKQKNAKGDIKTYRDVPGITADEISAIENIKASRSSLSYSYIIEYDSFLLPDGTRRGYSQRFCELMTELFEIEFVPVIYDAHDIQIKLDDKTLDFTGDIAASAQRIEEFGWHMSKPVAVRPFKLFTNINSKPITELTDLNGLKLGFWGASSTIMLLANSYPQLKYEVVPCSTLEDAADMLVTGEIDGFVMDAVVSSFFESYDYIRAQDIFTSVRKDVSVSTGNDDLAAIITVLDKYLVAGGHDKIAALYDIGSLEYAIYKLEKDFTDEERAYLSGLKEHNATVKVVVEYDGYPVSFYNSTEQEYQGIALDVLNEISILTSIEFEPITPSDNSWATLNEMVKQGEIPMAAQMFYSEARKDDFIWSSVPYDKSYYAILSKTDYPYISSTQVFNTAIGAINSSAYEDIYFEYFINGQDVVNYPNQNAALDALEKGEVDLLMASEYMLLAQTNYRERSGFKVNIRFDMPMESLFGFNKEEHVLRSIIDKAQAYIETDYIAINWTRRVFDYSQKITRQRAIYLGLASGILLIGLLAVTFFLQKNRRLYMEKTKTEQSLSEAHEIIVSNIEYSSKIQRNLLPKEDVFNKAFTDFSIIWSPRDIVGGDIYWMKNFAKGSVLCVCDCTGHGTSGALLSMLVAAIFEGKVDESNYMDTAQIVWLLDRGLSQILNVDTSSPEDSDDIVTEINDGCDLAVIFIANNGTASISAGHTNVFVCNGRKVNRIKGQNIYVGEGRLEKSDIKVVTVPANADNKFYIASDGLFDQLSDDEQQPFGYRKFSKLLLENHNNKQAVISENIWKEFEAHRGTAARLDDIELITFKHRKA